MFLVLCRLQLLQSHSPGLRGKCWVKPFSGFLKRNISVAYPTDEPFQNSENPRTGNKHGTKGPFGYFLLHSASESSSSAFLGFLVDVMDRVSMTL